GFAAGRALEEPFGALPLRREAVGFLLVRVLGTVGFQVESMVGLYARCGGTTASRRREDDRLGITAALRPRHRQEARIGFAVHLRERDQRADECDRARPGRVAPPRLEPFRELVVELSLRGVVPLGIPPMLVADFRYGR